MKLQEWKELRKIDNLQQLINEVSITGKNGSQIAISNNIAVQLIPKIIILRKEDDDEILIGFKKAREDDSEAYTLCREVNKGKAYYFSRSNLGFPNGRYRVFLDGDVFYIKLVKNLELKS